MITNVELLNTQIFQDFPPEDLDRIIHGLTEKNFHPNETIIYRGDPGYSLFLILGGTVEVTLINDEGIEYTINTQTQGDNFGEMALMTGEPRSANVKAVTEVRLAELHQDVFFELIAEHPKLGDAFLRQLAQRRGKTLMRQQFADLERSEIIANLFAQQPPSVDCFLGKTKWISDVNNSIKRLSAIDSHVLVLGERGTGKDLAARFIHFNGPSKSRPLFHLDCANPPPIQRESGTDKSGEKDELLLEIAQESALFGHSADAGSYARGIRKGYLELAEGGAVVLENIDSLTAHLQLHLIQYLKEGTFVRAGETERISSRTRLISTASGTFENLKTQGGLEPELLSLVSGEILLMKPLRERKKDIPVLADHLVQEYNKKFSKNVTGFSEEALNSLVDHDWPLNMDEMQQVLERAVVIADGDTITEKQVFMNPPTFSETGKFNLLKIPFFRHVADYPFFPEALRFVTVPFIFGLIILTLVGPPQRNPANLIVWAIWWPFLIFSILVGARSWCGFCPMPALSEWLNRKRSNFYPLPAFLVKYGSWIGISGFALILVAEHVTHMFTEARATSVLLLSILIGTTATNVLFGKRSWCKHFCPLGRMVADSSAISIVELGSNSNVCSSQCQTHDCIKDGNCPMGIHPSAAAVSKDCILCLSCLKRCRHQSVRLNVRFPWYEFFVKEKWNEAEGIFAVTLTALVLAIKLPSIRPLAQFAEQHMWSNHAVNDFVVSVMIGMVFIFLVLAASGVLSGESWKKNFAVLGSSYLFLAFAGFFNIYFHELVYHGHNFLPWIVEMSGFGATVPREWITPELGTLKVMVPLITLAGSIASLLLLSRLARKHSIPPFVRKGHQGILLVTTLVFLVIS
ncbi:MAG: sigma 54-interacting transcriptional regulator [Desulfuromonadales bacterium]